MLFHSFDRYSLSVTAEGRVACDLCEEPAGYRYDNGESPVRFACPAHKKQVEKAGTLTIFGSPTVVRDHTRLKPEQVRAFVDGDQIAVVPSDFVNLQESPVIAWIPALVGAAVAPGDPASSVPALLARVSALEAALAPFARMADAYSDRAKDTWSATSVVPNDGTDISVGDLRAARAALSGEAAPRSDTPDGVSLIAAERARQIAAEGWTPEHDDGHTTGDLARAAAAYALPPEARGFYGEDVENGHPPDLWPSWGEEWWKPTPDDRVRELVKAGALIAAEIDRLRRLAVGAVAGGGAAGDGNG